VQAEKLHRRREEGRTERNFLSVLLSSLPPAKVLVTSEHRVGQGNRRS
jgi:hypothetical protein